MATKQPNRDTDLQQERHRRSEALQGHHEFQITAPEPQLSEDDPPFMSAAELDELLAQAGHLSFLTEVHKEAIRKSHAIIRTAIIEGASTELLLTKIERDARRYMTPFQFARFEAMYLNPLREYGYSHIHWGNTQTFAKINDHMERMPVGIPPREEQPADDGFLDTFMGGVFKKRR